MINKIFNTNLTLIILTFLIMQLDLPKSTHVWIGGTFTILFLGLIIEILIMVWK